MVARSLRAAKSLIGSCNYGLSIVWCLHAVRSLTPIEGFSSFAVLDFTAERAASSPHIGPQEAGESEGYNQAIT